MNDYIPEKCLDIDISSFAQKNEYDKTDAGSYRLV